MWTVAYWSRKRKLGFAVAPILQGIITFTDKKAKLVRKKRKLKKVQYFSNHNKKTKRFEKCTKKIGAILQQAETEFRQQHPQDDPTERYTT